MEMTPCRIPFSAALAASAWSEYLKRFTNETNCTHCKREFTNDTFDRCWYRSEDCEFGMEPRWSDSITPVIAQQGWFCGEECRDEYLAKEAA
jgi:hypothetical protein